MHSCGLRLIPVPAGTSDRIGLTRLRPIAVRTLSGLLCCPAEGCAVPPDPVHDHGQLARDGDLGLLQRTALDDRHASCLSAVHCVERLSMTLAAANSDP